MSNFIGMVFATLKNEGIDTKGMSTDEAVKKYNELQKKTGGKAGADQPTPAENRRVGESSLKGEKESAGIRERTPAELDKMIADYSKEVEKYKKQGNESEAEWYQKQIDWANNEKQKGTGQTKDNMSNGADANEYKKVESMTTKEMKKEMAQHEKYLLKTYNEKQLKEFKNKYNEAKDILLLGGEVEDKRGLEFAQKHFYDEAEEIMRSLPKEYTRFRELDDELW